MKKNPFHELSKSVEPSAKLKGRVMSSVNMLGMVGDIAELFTLNLGRVVGEFVHGEDSDEESTEGNPESNDKTKD